ncbi:hypothetical protein RY831_31575 [Noviherbaspirillum sp. CPCC 100848]|uniref:Uncharacterized protein n=1 Tax=Noviherbaspirillum album TaxID=3080276 RepID=A0ABU6JJL9_9BURK|nr:hypothetical protein [Noviherbaspirillum sp. CPCC 100848]MEC4723666.1 hypothetical protein [Noviherbaspirillum sp. CPCC 100848]
MKPAKTAKPVIPAKAWKSMDAKERTIFVGKVCVMVCSAGFIFGGVLVEGMVYEQYPD